MDWSKLPAPREAEAIREESRIRPVLLFKHSIRCSTSALALSRIEKNWQLSDQQCRPYLIDVINERHTSNAIAQEFGVWHESPQVLLIRDGECVYHTSHLNIRYADIESRVK